MTLTVVSCWQSKDRLRHRGGAGEGKTRMTHPLVVGFRDHFAKFIVHIIAEWDSSGESKGMQATGFIAAPATDQDGVACCAVITARHVVVDRATSEVRWKLTRHADPGQENATYEFTSPGLIGPLTAVPGFIRTNEPGYDAAAIVIPLESGVMPPFFDMEKELPPHVIVPSKAIREGVDIAWAGYPGIITEALDRPQLCLYRGMVSAAILNISPGMYFVDGHVAYGVSGAPVWHSDEKGHRIIGVVSGYLVPGEEVPGLCHFAPVNILIDHMVSGVPIDGGSAKP